MNNSLINAVINEQSVKTVDQTYYLESAHVIIHNDTPISIDNCIWRIINYDDNTNKSFNCTITKNTPYSKGTKHFKTFNSVNVSLAHGIHIILLTGCTIQTIIDTTLDNSPYIGDWGTITKIEVIDPNKYSITICLEDKLDATIHYGDNPMTKIKTIGNPRLTSVDNSAFFFVDSIHHKIMIHNILPKNTLIDKIGGITITWSDYEQTNVIDDKPNFFLKRATIYYSNGMQCKVHRDAKIIFEKGCKLYADNAKIYLGAKKDFPIKLTNISGYLKNIKWENDIITLILTSHMMEISTNSLN